jgi:hypothetical protein
LRGENEQAWLSWTCGLWLSRISVIVTVSYWVKYLTTARGSHLNDNYNDNNNDGLRFKNNFDGDNFNNKETNKLSDNNDFEIDNGDYDENEHLARTHMCSAPKATFRPFISRRQ